jgi:uncharacterized delta-60 repeat protein
MIRRAVSIALFAFALYASTQPALAICVLASTPNDGYFDQTWAGYGCVTFVGDNTDPTATSEAKKILPTSDGGLLLGGTATGAKGSSYWWLAKIDAFGGFVSTFGDSDDSGRITECTLKPCGSLGFTDFDLQDDGKVSVLNSSYVTRMTANARALDTAGVAGGTGSVLNSFAIASPGGTLFASDSQGSGIATAPGGKTFVIGTGDPSTTPPATSDDFGIARLNGDLSLDTSFNAAAGPPGITYAGGNFIDMGTSAEASQIFQLPDGHLILASSNGYRDILAARLNSDGSLDTTYNSTGIHVITSVPAPVTNAGTLVRPAIVDRAGRVVFVLSGYGGGYFGALVTRFNADGTQDMSWKGYADGWVFYSVFPQCPNSGFQPSTVRPLAIDSAGRILIFGLCDSQLGMIRLRGDTGALDTSFGDSGIFHGHFDPASNTDSADAIVFDAAGHLFIGGGTYAGGSQFKSAVARLTYDLINANDFETLPRGCLPPRCE